MNTPEEIVILAVNTLNARAKEIVAYEREHFSKFIGKDIFKNNCEIKEKYKHDRLRYRRVQLEGYGIDVTYIIEYKYQRLSVDITVCINGGSYNVKPNTAFTHYEKTNITLFNAIKNELVETEISLGYLDTVYDLNELKAQAFQLNELAREYNLQLDKFPSRFNYLFNVERLCS